MKHFDIKRYWNFFKKEIFIVIISMITIISIVFIFSILTKPVYQSFAKIKITFSSSTPSLKNNLLYSPFSYLESRESLYDQIESIKSYFMIKNVVQKLLIEEVIKESLKNMQGSIVLNDLLEKSQQIILTKIVVDKNNKNEIINKLKELFSDENFEKEIKKISQEKKIFSLKEFDYFKTISLIMNSISVSKYLSLKESNIIIIKANAETPFKSAKIIQTLVQECISQNLINKKKCTKNVIIFIDTQIKILKNRLSNLLEKIRAFRQSNNMFLPNENTKILVEEISSLKTEINKLEFEEKEITMKLEQSKQYINEVNKQSTTKKEILNVPVIQQLRSQLAAIEVKYFVQSQSLTPFHSDMIKIEKEMNIMKNNLEKEISKKIDESFIITDELYQKNFCNIIEMENRLKIIDDKKKMMDDFIEKNKKDLNLSTQNEIDYYNLVEEKEMTENSYKMFLTKKEENRILEYKEVEGIEVVDFADENQCKIPIKPKIKNNILTAIGLGFLFSFGIIFIKEYFNNNFKNIDEIEKIYKLPVMGLIPFIKKEKFNNFDLGLITHFNPNSSICEFYKIFRTSIEFSRLGKEIKILFLTSAFPGEGKSTVISNLAIVMAQIDKKVLLVDNDLRKPVLHKMFQCNRENGMTDFLLNPLKNISEYVKSTQINNLFLMTSGSFTLNPSELLNSKKMDIFLEKAKEQFDLVLLDTPPTIVTDTVVLIPKVDGFVVVLDLNISNKKNVFAIEKILTNNQKKCLGIIINKINFDNHFFYYNNYYNNEKTKK
ncbi:MAG: polysaccharide biosynthesis tyrosine autokinase [bacterium]